MDTTNHKFTATAWTITNTVTLALGCVGFIGGNAIAAFFFMAIVWIAIAFGALMIALSAASNTLPETRNDIPIGLLALKDMAIAWLLINGGHPLAATFVILIITTHIVSAVKNERARTNNTAAHQDNK